MANSHGSQSFERSQSPWLVSLHVWRGLPCVTERSEGAEWAPSPAFMTCGRANAKLGDSLAINSHGEGTASAVPKRSKKYAGFSP